MVPGGFGTLFDHDNPNALKLVCEHMNDDKVCMSVQERTVSVKRWNTHVKDAKTRPIDWHALLLCDKKATVCPLNATYRSDHYSGQSMIRITFIMMTENNEKEENKCA